MRTKPYSLPSWRNFARNCPTRTSATVQMRRRRSTTTLSSLPSAGGPGCRVVSSVESRITGRAGFAREHCQDGQELREESSWQTDSWRACQTLLVLRRDMLPGTDPHDADRRIIAAASAKAGVTIALSYGRDDGNFNRTRTAHFAFAQHRTSRVRRRLANIALSEETIPHGEKGQIAASRSTDCVDHPARTWPSR